MNCKIYADFELIQPGPSPVLAFTDNDGFASLAICESGSCYVVIVKDNGLTFRYNIDSTAQDIIMIPGY